jgi:GH24 family phage-related lysozyme (muramidase)
MEYIEGEAAKLRAVDRLAQPQEIEKWMTNALSDRAPATLNRYRALLSLTYRLGIANRKVSTNLARLVRQRTENNARIRWLVQSGATDTRTDTETSKPITAGATKLQ